MNHKSIDSNDNCNERQRRTKKGEQNFYSFNKTNLLAIKHCVYIGNQQANSGTTSVQSINCVSNAKKRTHDLI